MIRRWMAQDDQNVIEIHGIEADIAASELEERKRELEETQKRLEEALQTAQAEHRQMERNLEQLNQENATLANRSQRRARLDQLDEDSRSTALQRPANRVSPKTQLGIPRNPNLNLCSTLLRQRKEKVKVLINSL